MSKASFWWYLVPVVYANLRHVQVGQVFMKSMMSSCEVFCFEELRSASKDCRLDFLLFRDLFLDAASVDAGTMDFGIVDLRRSSSTTLRESAEVLVLSLIPLRTTSRAGFVDSSVVIELHCEHCTLTDIDDVFFASLSCRLRGPALLLKMELFHPRTRIVPQELQVQPFFSEATLLYAGSSFRDDRSSAATVGDAVAKRRDALSRNVVRQVAAEFIAIAGSSVPFTLARIVRRCEVVVDDICLSPKSKCQGVLTKRGEVGQAHASPLRSTSNNFGLARTFTSSQISLRQVGT